jgi:hypothetical protein
MYRRTVASETYPTEAATYDFDHGTRRRPSHANSARSTRDVRPVNFRATSAGKSVGWTLRRWPRGRPSPPEPRSANRSRRRSPRELVQTERHPSTEKPSAVLRAPHDVQTQRRDPTSRTTKASIRHDKTSRRAGCDTHRRGRGVAPSPDSPDGGSRQSPRGDLMGIARFALAGSTHHMNVATARN